MWNELLAALEALLARFPGPIQREIVLLRDARIRMLPGAPEEDMDGEIGRAIAIMRSKILMESIVEGTRKCFMEALTARESCVRQAMAIWLMANGAEELAAKICSSTKEELAESREVLSRFEETRDTTKIEPSRCDCGGPPGHVGGGMNCRKA